MPVEVEYNGSMFSTITPHVQEKSTLDQIYSISYMYYSLIGTFITVFVGIVVSYMTASLDDAYDSKLIHPWFLKMSNWFPGKPRYYKDEVPLKGAHNGHGNHTTEIHDNLGFELKTPLDNCEKDESNGTLRNGIDVKIEICDPDKALTKTQTANGNAISMEGDKKLNGEAVRRFTTIEKIENYRRIDDGDHDGVRS